MYPFSKIQGGTLTATASTPQDIQIASMDPPDYFVMKNITKWGNGGATGYDVEWWWERSMTQGTAKGINQAATTFILSNTQLTTDGFYTYNTAVPPTFTANTSVTAVTRGAANGVTVVTLTNDGTLGPRIHTGDYVRLYNIAGMQQISGMLFQVVNTTATTSITIDLDSNAFAADGTTGVCQKVIKPLYYPRYNYVTRMTVSGTSTIINTTYDTNFTVGEEVSLRIPPSVSGFTTNSAANNLKGVVTAVTNATATTCSRITVSINTAGLGTFALPTSAQAAVGIGEAPVSMLLPAGSGVIPGAIPPAMNIQDAFDNRNLWVIHLGGSIFTNSATSDVWMWQAYKYDQYNGN